MSEKQPTGECSNCVGACCREGIILQLNSREAANSRAAGTKLKEFLPSGDDVNWGSMFYRIIHGRGAPRHILKKVPTMDLQPGQGVYGFESDCGFLEETEDHLFICSVHDDPELKPDACSSFRAGSRACGKIRTQVLSEMLQEDSLIPSLAGVALGEEVFRNFEYL